MANTTDHPLSAVMTGNPRRLEMDDGHFGAIMDWMDRYQEALGAPGAVRVARLPDDAVMTADPSVIVKRIDAVIPAQPAPRRLPRVPQPPDIDVSPEPEAATARVTVSPSVRPDDSSETAGVAPFASDDAVAVGADRFVADAPVDTSDMASIFSDLPRFGEPLRAKRGPVSEATDKTSDDVYQEKMRQTLDESYRFLAGCAHELSLDIALSKETRASISRHASYVQSIDPSTLNPVNQRMRRLAVATLQTCAGTRNILTFGTHLA